MGKKPTTVAASAASIEPVMTGTTAVVTAGTATVEPAMAGPAVLTASGRFAMPHALVIIACIVTAAVLAPDSMSVQDVLLLLAGAGGIGAGVVLVVVTGGRRGSRIARSVRAYFSSDE
ncbi:hypothetical protein AB0L33_34165 [Streptomyces sp. NPDC052299]|uniref:hypothetical protein n=1 Tax=Streptomyces sp. NPDC052299 TaxID=3155054 RepID=UPI0034461B3B